ncbi:MAG: YfiR family protein [Phycisphaerae bacterium]
MRRKTYHIILLIFTLFFCTATPAAGNDSAEFREYQVKAAFLYNFTKFVDWPDEIMSDASQPFIIGIICDEGTHKDAYVPLEKEQVKGKNIILMHMNKLVLPTKPEDDSLEEFQTNIQQVKQCHLLFICKSAIKKHNDIIRIVGESPVLTVTESSDFSEEYSIINFVKQDQKVRFEVSLTQAKKSHIKVRSGLLRLAVRVLGREQED